MSSRVINHIGYTRVILCDCGEELACWDITNECECHRLYNFAGQGLRQLEFTQYELELEYDG